MGNYFVKLLQQDYDHLSKLEGKTKTDVKNLGQSAFLSLFDVIDTNGDSKIDSHEVSVFQQLISSADKDNDGNITKKEIRKLLKTNSEFANEIAKNGKIKAADVINFISRLTTVTNEDKTIQKVEKPEYDFNYESVEEAQDAAIDMLQEEVNNGYAILNGLDEGVVARSYNELKELFGSQLSKSSVAKNLFIKNETAELLRRARQNDLTKQEYYCAIKENLMETFPGVENMSEENLQKLADMINSLSPDEVMAMQKQILELPSPDNPKYENAVNNFVSNFILSTCTVKTSEMNITQDGVQYHSFDTQYEPKPAYSLEDANGLMTFEEVYKARNGVEFNQEKIEYYNQLSSVFALQESFSEIQTLIHDSLDKAKSDKKIEKAVIDILCQFTQANDDESLTKALRYMTGIDDISVVNGKIEASNMNVVKEALLSKIDAQTAEINGGKTMEELSQELEKAYKEAFGKENVELLAKAYAEESDKFVKNTRRTVEYTSLAATVIGLICCPPLAIGAGIVGSIGGVGVEMLDEATKQNTSSERMKELSRELGMNAALFAAGMGSGIAGSAAGAITKTLATKCPVLLSIVAERGVDATLSLISIKAITGELDLQGVGLDQLLAIVAGLKSAKVGIKNAPKEAEPLGIISPHKNILGKFSKFFGLNSDASGVSEQISTTKLSKGQYLELQGSAKLNLANTMEIDLNDIRIKSKIDNLPEGGRLTIGREGDILICDPTKHVSRIHIIVEKRNGKIYIIDNSTNGTTVTQTKVSNPIAPGANQDYYGALEKGQRYQINNYPELNLADTVTIDLNTPNIKAMIDNLPEGGRLTIGREGDILINDPTNHVSRIHVIIEKHNGKIYVIDQSTNGTTMVKPNVHKSGNAIQQSRDFNTNHRIGSDEVIMNGYKDGGRKLQFDEYGHVINEPTREIILVDRTRDTKLQSIISDVKRKTCNMTDKQKAAFLQRYIYNLCGDGGIAANNLTSWVKTNKGIEVLLGDIITANPPVAVCRHRSLLLKILGDEIGLKVELQRGNFNNGRSGGGHAWNVIKFNDGTSAIYDAMHNITSNITPGHIDDYAKYYKTVDNERLYY